MHRLDESGNLNYDLAPDHPFAVSPTRAASGHNQTVCDGSGHISHSNGSRGARTEEQASNSMCNFPHDHDAERDKQRHDCQSQYRVESSKQR